MFDRLSPRALFFAALALPLAGCTNQLVTTLSVNPTAQTLAVGQTVQFTATGTVGHGSNHPPSTNDVTGQVTWTSSAPAVATINGSGLATAITAGSTTITAKINGFTGLLTAYATVTVSTSGGGTGTITGITSLAVIPSTQAVAAPGDTAQFIAIGTSASGSTVDLTGQVAWRSSSVQIATVVGNSGLATAVGQGADTITAVYTNPGNGGSTITGTATFTVTAGTTEQFTALTIIPGSQSVSAAGQKGQFIAIGTLGSNGLQEDVTNSPNIIWLSSIPAIATISTGLATGNGAVTGVSQGSSTITAELRNPDGSIVNATAAVTITLTAPPEPILSLTVIPNSITVLDFQLTGQFLAVATYATAPYVRDVTNDPNTTWLSSEPEMFPVNTNSGGNAGASAGLVTAYASGGAVIIAEAKATDGTIQTATATFACPEVLPGPGVTTPSCYPGEPLASTLLSTLTVYNEGLNTSNWEVTAASATGTPDVLHCGPGWTLGGGTGGSVCTATYPAAAVTPAGTPGVLLEAQQAGGGPGTFGGWSYSCAPSDSTGKLLTAPPYWTAAGPNYCVAPVVFACGTTTCGVDVTVGAIFN